MPRSRFSDEYMRQMRDRAAEQEARPYEPVPRQEKPEPPCIKRQMGGDGIAIEWRTETVPPEGMSYLATNFVFDTATRTRKIYAWKPL